LGGRPSQRPPPRSAWASPSSPTTSAAPSAGGGVASHGKRGLRPWANTDQTFDLLGIYCRGLLSDLPRKTCEPLALYAGVAVRTVQEFLKDHQWSYSQARDVLRGHVAQQLPDWPADELGTPGIIDETGVVKKGNCTPGVQHQCCGELGKRANCVVPSTSAWPAAATRP
jgi:SRSO17 transposase